GTLYPALRRMEKKGYLESEWIAKDAGVPRKYYEITKKGRTVLEEAEEVWKRLRGSIDTVLGRGAP
ncbi:MAG: helix-turn-helix transcriptional regulator, partial [Thermoplasmata archaeon]